MSSTSNNKAYDLVSIAVYALLTTVVVFLILRYYTKESRMKWGLYVPLFVTYLILFTSFPLISIDLAAGLYAKTSQTDPTRQNDPARYMVVLWNIIYWSIQVLAWLIIPVCMSYVYTGEFTFFRRILDSIWQNVIMYSIMAIVGGLAIVGLVTYLIIMKKGLDFNMLIAIGQSLSNSYGLLLFISLMGYGVVEVPRYFWREANLERSLQYCEFQASKLYDSIADYEHDLREKLAIVRTLDMKMDHTDELRYCVDQMVKNCEQQLEKLQIGAVDNSVSTDNLTRGKLAKIHRDALFKMSEFSRIDYQWKALQDRAFFLEDVINSINNSTERRIVSSFKGPRKGVLAMLDFPEWVYYKYIRAFMFRFLAIACIPIALILIYSQFTPLVASVMPKDPKKQRDISVISLLIRSMTNADGWARILMQVTSLVVVIIMASTTIYALFKMEIYSIFQLIPHHSDTYSVLYTAIFLCRIVPTLCFNFLQIANVRESDGVAYYKVMGVMRVDGLKDLVGGNKALAYLYVLGGGFANYFPMVMVIISAITLFNVTGYLGSLCNVKRFIFNEQFIDEEIEEGRALLQREKRKRMNDMDIKTRNDAELEFVRNDGDDDDDTKIMLSDNMHQKSVSDRLNDLYAKHKKERPSKSNYSSYSI